jgi:radical SAM protein with 4Fe4S-binding SPASM domain
LRPLVVWSATPACNLHCAHCPADSRARPSSGELSTAEARSLIEDLARFGVKTLVFAGGNPLLRADFPELVTCAAAVGLGPVLVSNGTLITPAVARQLRRAGLEAVKIPMDGIGDASDKYRGKKGAFQLALQGYRNSVEAGLPVTLRLPLARRHFPQLDSIFDFLEQEGISQVCFQHLLYAGRGNAPRDDLTHAQSRRALDLIWQRAQDLSGRPGVSISTAANYVDGIYLYGKLFKQDPLRARALFRELRRKGGARRGSGVGMGHIDAEGNVHPDPAWRDHSFGNIRQRPFRELWFDLSDPLMFGLKNRLPLLKGRCAACRWKPLCGGNIRSRAAMVYGDPWMPDPACYLTNDERRQEGTGPGEVAGEESQRKKEAA